jgi:peptide/nickel transport system permease protein
MTGAARTRGVGHALFAAVGRLLAALAVVLVVGSVVFLAFRLLPGDPGALVLGERSTEAERVALRARLHLDEPLFTQYRLFLGRLAHGRAGPSLRKPDVDAAKIVLDALPSTAALAALAVSLGAFFGIALALIAAGARRPFARGLARRAIALSSSISLLAFAPAATWVLAVRMRIVPLPADPDAGFRGLLFASILLAIPLGAAVGRITHGALAEAAASPFLQVARAKGRSELAVWLVHALPTCVGPIVTVLAAQLGALLGGAIVLERLLERRGLGTVLADALAARDLPVIEATVLVAAALFVLVQGAGMRAHAYLDPRVRS